jgi:probable HAF family extracellular repeat protein
MRSGCPLWSVGGNVYLKRVMNMRMGITLLLAVTLLVAASARAERELIDLGAMGGSLSVACAVNDAGVVAGYYYPPPVATKCGFVYSNGVMTDVGSLGGPWTAAWGVNNSGQVVGESGGYGFMYSGGSLSRLDQRIWIANAINNSGQVAATDSSSRACIYKDGLLTYPSIPGSLSSTARGINDSGAMVGYYLNYGSNRGFIYSGGVTTALGTFGGSEGSALAINNLGQVTGSAATADGLYHALLYSNGVMSDLGVLQGAQCSDGCSINDKGEVVGYSGLYGISETNRAFLYSGGQMTDLNTLLSPKDSSRWLLGSALDINNNGWIVGYATDLASQERHAFLLTPEPTTLVIMGLGGMVLRRRQKAPGERH